MRKLSFDHSSGTDGSVRNDGYLILVSVSIAEVNNVAKVLFCKECGTDCVWPKAVDHLEFPVDDETWEEFTKTDSLEWICENGHVGEPMVDILADVPYYKAKETMTYSEFKDLRKELKDLKTVVRTTLVG